MSANTNTTTVVVDLNKVIAVLQQLATQSVAAVPATTVEDKISKASAAWNKSDTCNKRRLAHRIARANWIRSFLTKSGDPLSSQEWKDLLSKAQQPTTENKK